MFDLDFQGQLSRSDNNNNNNNNDNLNTPGSRTVSSCEQYGTNLRRGLARDLGQWLTEIVSFKPCSWKSGVIVRTLLQGAFVQILGAHDLKAREPNLVDEYVVQGDWN